MSGAEQRFTNVLEVVDYLQDQGWKIKKSRAYQHRKDGRLQPEDDGFFYRSAVDKYAKRWLEPISPTADPEIEGLQRDKLAADVDKSKAQADHWMVKTQRERGQVIDRHVVVEEFGARAAFLRSDFELFWRTKAPEVIALVAGDPKLAGQLVEYGLQAVNTWLERYTGPMDFAVPEIIEEKD